MPRPRISVFGLRARIAALVFVGFAVLAITMGQASSARLADVYDDAGRAQLRAIATTWSDGLDADDLERPAALQRRVEDIKASIPELHKIALTWTAADGTQLLVQAGHEHDAKGGKRDVTTPSAVPGPAARRGTDAPAPDRFREVRAGEDVHYAALDRRIVVGRGGPSAALELHYDLKELDQARQADAWAVVETVAWATLVFGGLIALLLGRVVVRPLDRIRAATNALRAGDHGTRLGWSRGDEIGQLARDFDHMADELLEALKDSLTGLLNHRAFQERLHEELARARRDGSPVSVIALDVDGFKTVNDAHGHAAGDDALRMVAATIRAELRTSDHCGRVGGDEFMLALPGVEAGQALHVAERLRSRIAALATDTGHPLTVSLGVAAFPEHAAGRDELLHFADGAMYWSKSNGKDQATLFSPDRDLALSAADAAERNLRAGLVNTVHALARAVDAKDGYTHSHSQRVAGYAVALGRRLGLAEDRLERVRTAGVLHDIGKIGISDAVLLKPGRLSDDEFDAMRRHSALGHDIIAGAGLDEIATWVLHLHERFDGRGYPQGCAGQDIPLESRVLHCADALEAMTSSRVYRSALPLETALAELRRGAGTQFDPEVVDALLALVESGELVVDGERTADALPVG